MDDKGTGDASIKEGCYSYCVFALRVIGPTGDSQRYSCDDF